MEDHPHTTLFEAPWESVFVPLSTNLFPFSTRRSIFATLARMAGLGHAQGRENHGVVYLQGEELLAVR